MLSAFTAGPPVHGHNFFGRSRLISMLRDSIATGHESVLLIGESRIGKSSILLQLAHLTRQTTDSAVFFDGYVEAGGLATSLGHALDSVASLGGRASRVGQKGLFHLLRLLESSPERLTIMVDEVDQLVSDKESARFIRSVACMGHKVVLATSRIDLSQRETPPDEPIWWNVFRIEYVGLFEESEAKEMLLTLSEQSGNRFTDGECQFFIDLMGPFPFFLQWLGREIFSHGFRDCTISKRKELLLDVTTDISTYSILTAYYRGWLERLDEKQLQLLWRSASGRGIAPDPALAILKNRGLLVEDTSGRWRPFSRLLGEFVKSIPKPSLFSADIKEKIWQGFLPALKTFFEVAAKHYLSDSGWVGPTIGRRRA